MVSALIKTIGLPPSKGAVTGLASGADRRKRIPWNEVVQLFERAEVSLGRDEVLRRFEVHHERFPEAFALARAVVTPAQFARFYFFVASGATPCLDTRLTVTDELVDFHLWIPAHLRDSETYLAATAVILAHLPCYLGHPAVNVSPRVEPRHLHVQIPLPPSDTLLVRARDEAVRARELAFAAFDNFMGDVTLSMRGERFGRDGADNFEGRLSVVATRWRLTPREAEALGHLARGRSNKEIAAALRCAPRTVEIHVSHILEKSGLESRAEVSAAFWAEP